MAVGKLGRKDGLRRPPVGFTFSNDICSCFSSDVDRQCFAGSPGNAPTLDSFNSFSLLESESECTISHEGVTPPINCNTIRDSTPTFISSSCSENCRRKPLKNVKIEIPKTSSLPIPTISVQVPDGGYLDEYLSASYIVGSFSQNHFRIPIILGGLQRSVRATAMIDSGATALFMNRRYARQHKMLLTELEHPIYVRNIDGTENSTLR